ncbi:MAG: hypothetical protein ABEJ98_00070 [Candidatus Nanohaloarchaea archaeon]
MEEKFSAVLVAGLTIFGLVFALDHVGVASGPQQRVLMQGSPGDVGQATEDLRTIRFGSFTVGEARGDIKVFEEERASLEDMMFGGNAVKFRYNATQPRGGKITFEVLGRRGKGTVYVKVNGKKIFDRYLISTGTPEVKIPEGALHSGVNTFKIGTSADFLKESVYTIEDVEARVNDRKFHDFEDSFQMYSHELKNFVSANVTFALPPDSSTPSSPLKMYINDNLLFNRSISRSVQEVRVTMQNADLQRGENTITFETDGEARYSLRNVMMNVRYIGNVRPGSFETEFELGDARLDYANRRATTEYIEFSYIPLESVSPIEIDLNSFNTTFNPERGENRIELPESAVKASNSISMESASSFRLSSLRVVSERG